MSLQEANNSRILQSYFVLLSQLNDLDTAEQGYLKALHREPNNLGTSLDLSLSDVLDMIRGYAHFLSAYRHNHQEAERYNLKGLEIAPDDPYILVNYASSLLLQDGKESYGITAIHRALRTKWYFCDPESN